MASAPWEVKVASSRPARPRWSFVARQIGWAAVDLVLPPRCAGCGQAGERFCAACQAQVSVLQPPVCAWCGYPTAQAGVCLNCRGQSRAGLAGIRSAAFFEGPLQAALHQLKYRRDVILADSLARWVARAWDPAEAPGQVVVPVPLSAQRLRERGYNQAGLLARGFADLAGLRFRPQALRKVRHTATQVGLSAAARQTNVQGAFTAQPAGVAGQTVLLVDDVCTTGATLRAAAAALQAAGAVSVWALTVARAR